MVPRLELDISADDSAFDHINKLFSVANTKKVKQEGNKDAAICQKNVAKKDRKRNEKYEVKSEDVIVELEKSLPKRKKENQNESEKQANVKVKGDGKEADRGILLNHLKFLDSFQERNDEDANNTAEKLQFFAEEGTTAKWWKRQRKLSKKELLKISLQSLEKYYNVVLNKIEEINRFSDDLRNEKTNNFALQDNLEQSDIRITEMMEALDEISKAKSEEQQKHKATIQQMRDGMDCEAKKWRSEVENLKLEKKKCRDDIATLRTDKEECRRRNKNAIEEILKESSEEKKKVVKVMNKLKEDKEKNEKYLKMEINRKNEEIEDAKLEKARLENVVKELSQYNQGKNVGKYEKAIKRLESLLKEKELEIVNLSEKLMTLEDSSNNIIRNLREELLLKEKQLIEVRERYENQFMIAKLFEKTFSEHENVVELPKSACNRCNHENVENNKTENEGRNGMMEEKKHCFEKGEINNNINSLEASSTKHKHFIDSMTKQDLDSKVSTSQGDSIKTFAILKVEDIWEEQILCHQSNVEKLKEMQNMRKDLIQTRRQLETVMQENLELKEGINRDMKIRENRWKELVNKQIFEMQRKDEEIDNLKLELLRSKQESSSLSKQLQKSLMVQRSKEKEIELLNVTVQAERNEEYCTMSTESMANFKLQMKKLKEENTYLLAHCDKLEGKMEESNRALEKSKKISDDAKGRENAMEETYAELKSELNAKNSSLRKLKETVRQLQLKCENGKEEMIDKNYEINIYGKRLEKTEKRLLEMEESKTKLEKENSMAMKKLVETERDLQKSLNMIYEMKMRYENVEEKFKDKEEEIKRLSNDLSEKENEIKLLNDDKRLLDNEKERLIRELEDTRGEKYGLIEKLEKRDEKYKDEINKLETTLANVEKELKKEEKENKEKGKEVALLYDEIKEFKDKMESMVGESDFRLVEKEINELKREIDVSHKENYELRNEKDEIEGKIEKLETENGELKSRVKEVEDENNQLFDELKQKEKEIDDKMQTLSEFKAKLQTKSR